MMQQLYASVCGNGHILSDMLDRPFDPGTADVPRLCPHCSAPVFTRCTNEGCDAPINGDKASGVIVVAPPRADWFCQQCGRPYLWAKPAQIRNWVSNRLQFDPSVDEDAQMELIATLAILTPGEPEADADTFDRFRAALKSVPALYAEVKPFLPMLMQLAHAAT